VFHLLVVTELIRQPSASACAEEVAAVPKLPFVAEHPDVEETTEPVLTAENTSSMQALEPADVLRLLVNDAVVTPDSISLCGDSSVPPSLMPSPCGYTSGSKPVTGDVHLTVSTTATVASSHLSDNTATLSPHSAGPVASPVSTGSDEVFIASFSQNSPSAPLIEPSSSSDSAAVVDGQEVQLPLSATAADDAFVFEQMEVNNTFENEISQLSQVHSSLFDDDDCCPSSPSESESEPLGGCKDALLNPDHCISDLCLEDNDNDSVLGAAGFRSPATTDVVDNYNNSLSADTVLFNAAHSLALSVVNSTIRHDGDNLLDVSKLDVSSFSNLYNVTPLTLVCDEPNSCSTTSDTATCPFRSPSKTSVCAETSLYSCVTPVNTSSPFRSPPRSSASILEGRRMWNGTFVVEDVGATKMLPSDDAPFSEILDSEANGADQTTCDENSQNIFTVEDSAVIAGNDECHGSQLSGHQYSLEWTSELPVDTASITSVETPVKVVTRNSSENSVYNLLGEVRFRKGSPSWCDMYCRDKASRQTSVKQLKSKFESQQNSGSQVGAKSSPNFSFIPNFAETDFSFTSQANAAHSSSAETTNGNCANFPNSDAVYHNAEHHASPSAHKPSDIAPAREHDKPSISARISCFEPVMPGCQKENKRARLSSTSSVTLDLTEKQLKCSSHSINEPFTERHQRDSDNWFEESPHCGPAKRYQRSSSAGHEDLLALLNIPATSAKNIPRVSERKRMFEAETADHKTSGSESASIVVCNSPASECDQYSRASQRLSGMDKENSIHMYENNCKGQVNSRRSLFEGISICHTRNDSVDSDSSVELDCRPFKYPVNRIKTKSRCLQTAVPVAGSFEQFKLT